ncbi:MAG: hypothetical protein JWO44_563 [Bacteroidetes bacterium]|nr:hypothetical protein [Bacteroidota bacterium]
MLFQVSFAEGGGEEAMRKLLHRICPSWFCHALLDTASLRNVAVSRIPTSYDYSEIPVPGSSPGQA